MPRALSRCYLEAAPDVLVDLHQAEVVGRGFQVGDAIALEDELAPTALLPRRALYQPQVERTKAVVDILLDDLALRSILQKLIIVAAIFGRVGRGHHYAL